MVTFDLQAQVHEHSSEQKCGLKLQVERVFLVNSHSLCSVDAIVVGGAGLCASHFSLCLLNICWHNMAGQHKGFKFRGRGNKRVSL